MKELVIKEKKTIQENPFYVANKLRNNVIGSRDGQELFYIKTCLMLPNVLEAIAASIYVQNSFLSKECIEYEEFQEARRNKTGNNRMTEEETKFYVAWKEKMNEAEIFASHNQMKHILEGLLGLYSMTSMNEKEATEFCTGIVSVETFLERLGINGLQVNINAETKKPISYIFRFIIQSLIGSREVACEDWEHEIGQRLTDLVEEYQTLEEDEKVRKQKERSELARKQKNL